MAVTGTTFSNKAATTTTAELRTLCGSQISAGIAAAGMVKTTDTGQVDWTTITWVAGIQTWGYEIWRFGDALHATKPVFVRLLYTATNASVLNITAQLGTGTDGAGNLTSAPNTGVSVTAVMDICKAGSGAVSVIQVSPWYIYGDGSSLVISSAPERMTGSTTTGYGGYFYVERARDTDGTPLGDGFNYCYMPGNASNAYTQTVLQHNFYTQPGNAQGVGYFPLSGGQLSSGVLGSTMFTMPWFTGNTPRLGAPSQIIIGVNRADMSVGNQFTCKHYGADRTFVYIGPPYANVQSFCMGGNLGGIYPALRTT